MVILKALKAQQNEAGYSFVAELEADTRVVRVPLSADDLMHYANFQARVLSATGLLFFSPMVEGRTAEQADYFWRCLASGLLETEPAPAAKPNARTPATVN